MSMNLIEGKDKLAKLETGHKELLNNLHDVEVQISSVQAKIDGLSKICQLRILIPWHKQIESLETEINTYDEQLKAL